MMWYAIIWCSALFRRTTSTESAPPSRCRSRWTEPLTLKSPEKYAGDLAISIEIARRNAWKLGHSLQDEIKILMLHGILHLTGYDHESDNGEMAKLEEELRLKLGLPATLISRSQIKVPHIN